MMGDVARSDESTTGRGGKAKGGVRCCRCGGVAPTQLKLRQCQHVTCLACAIAHLTHWIRSGKARIKCVENECAERIHENDVRQLLQDAENEELNAVMPPAERQYLLYKHDKDVIFYALGGDRFARQCPQCRNVFARQTGCNFVRCPNLRCNTWFCFECGLPSPSWQHFAQGMCKVAWDDVWKATYLLRFLLITNGCVLFFISPFVFLAFTFVLPIFTGFAFPVVVLRRLRKTLAADDGKAPQGFVWMCILLFPLLLIPGLALGLFSFFTGLCLYLLYLLLVFIKCIPGVGQIDMVINMVTSALAFLGFSSWRQIIRDAKESKDNQKIEELQRVLEQSEKAAALDENNNPPTKLESGTLIAQSILKKKVQTAMKEKAIAAGGKKLEMLQMVTTKK